jgi:signal transduction histidine kinase
LQQQVIGAELRQSRDLLRVILDNLTEGLLLLDANGRILAINLTLSRLVERNPQELVGQGYDQFWADLEGHAGFVLALYGPLLANTQLTDLRSLERFQPEALSFQLHLCNHIGAERWFAIERVPISNDGNRRCFERWLDITQQEELQRRTLINEQLITLGRLAASVAHEVGNPLQSAMSCLELCREEEDLSPRVHEYMGLAIGELERMGRTLEGLRTLYRSPQTVWAACDLNELLRMNQRLTRQQLARQRITMRLELDDCLPMVYAQVDSLRQVLLNLTLNAQEAIGEGGEIVISSEYLPEQHYCQLRIRDSGHGFSPEQQQHLFEPFHSTKTRGVGLGLYLCKQIIEQHNGQIRAETIPHTGAVIIIMLPLDRSIEH